MSRSLVCVCVCSCVPFFSCILPTYSSLSIFSNVTVPSFIAFIHNNSLLFHWVYSQKSNVLFPLHLFLIPDLFCLITIVCKYKLRLTFSGKLFPVKPDLSTFSSHNLNIYFKQQQRNTLHIKFAGVTPSDIFVYSRKAFAKSTN